MTEEIVELLPSKSLKEQITVCGRVFSRRELLQILYQYAPSFQQRLSLLSRFASSENDEYSKLALLYKEKEELNFKRFVEESQGFLYELHIRANPDIGEECYLCTDYETALTCIDRYLEEYEDDSPESRYRIVKRKIFTGDPRNEFGEDALGECVLGQNKTLLSVTLYEDHSNCTNHFNCDECDKLCADRGTTVYFPDFVPDCGAVLFTNFYGKKRFGICLQFDDNGTLDDMLYIIPLDSVYLYGKNFEDAHYDHQHIAPPLVENVSEEELDEELLENYRAYRAYWQAYWQAHWQAYLQEEAQKTHKP